MARNTETWKPETKTGKVEQDISLFFLSEELFLDGDNGRAGGLCELGEKDFVEKSEHFG